jgi:hypothetical protein
MLAEEAIDALIWRDGQLGNEYCERLKKEFPKINSDKILKNIEEQFVDESYGIELMSIGIYHKTFYNINNRHYTFKNKFESRVLEYPIKESNFKANEKIKNLKEIVDLFNLIGEKLSSDKNNFEFKNSDELDLIWKYRKRIYWGCIPHDIDRIIIKYICENIKITERVINKYYESFYKDFKRNYPKKIKLTTDCSKLIGDLKTSDIEIHKKLVIISLLGKRDDYEDYIQFLLKQYHNNEFYNKEEIEDILYTVI